MYLLPAFNTFLTIIIVIIVFEDIIRIFWLNSGHNHHPNHHHYSSSTTKFLISAFPLKKLLKLQLKQLKQENKAKKYGLKKVKYLNVEEHHQHIYLNDYILPKQSKPYKPKPKPYKKKIKTTTTTTTTTTPKPTKYIYPPHQPIAAIPVYVPQHQQYSYGDHHYSYDGHQSYQPTNYDDDENYGTIHSDYISYPYDQYHDHYDDNVDDDYNHNNNCMMNYGQNHHQNQNYNENNDYYGQYYGNDNYNYDDDNVHYDHIYNGIPASRINRRQQQSNPLNFIRPSSLSSHRCYRYQSPLWQYFSKIG